MLRTLFKDLFGRIRRGGRVRREAEETPAPGVADLLREGDARRQAGQLDRARECYAKAIKLDANHAEACYALALLEGQAGDYAASARHLKRLLTAHPRHADGWNALGNIERLHRKWQAAITSYRRAVALDPDLASALSNLGICLRNQGMEIEAMEYLARAAALDPANTEIRFNAILGIIDAGTVEEGVQELRRILEQQPQNAQARVALASQLLAAGRFHEGWPEYEWRNRVESWERRNAEYAYPWWNGEDLAGRRLLVRAEQGLGDQIMFASCLPDLLQSNGRVILECDPRLEPIFARSFPGAAVYPQTRKGAGAKERLDAELQINLGSLPLLMRRDESDFPVHGGYLRADPSKVARWRERLAGLGPAVKVGMSWRGGTLNTRQLVRSLPLRNLAPSLRDIPAVFVSVQYGDCASELEDLKRQEAMAIHHWQDAIDDYDETAALVAALDLVISVQSAVVHLGGALGRPVWVMVPSRPEWRYMQSGDRMPWYPSVKLFRQQAPGQWQPVIERIAAGLSQMARMVPPSPRDT